MAPLAPLKSAHIILAIQPTLHDCEPLLQATESHFAFSLDASQPISTQIESVQHCRRSALTTSRLLGVHLGQLTHLYDDWVAIIRKFTPRDDPDQVLAEQQAFQQMNEPPDGLRSMLNQLRTTIQKLEFLDQDLGDMLDRLSTTPCTTPPLGSNPLGSSQTPQQSTAPPNIPNSPSPRNGDAPSNVHLPKLQLPMFDGKPYEWFEFWELFEATIDLSSLSDVEKLAYLTSCLRGKAKDVAAGYTRRGDNYQPLVAALRTQFGNKDALTRQLQSDLRTIRPPSHNGPDLLRFYNDASRILHHMQIADVDPEQHQVLFTLEECLPEPTRILMYPEKQKCSHYSTADFRRILLNIAQMLMSVQPLQPQTPPSGQFSFGPQKENGWNNASRNGMELKPNYHEYVFSTNQRGAPDRYRQQRRTSSSLAFTGLSRERDPYKNRLNQRISFTNRKRQQTPTAPCAFCNDLHWHKECPYYSTLEQRRSRAAELHLCFRCLKPDHQVKECLRHNKCQSCGGAHNTLLCLPRTRGPRKPVQIHAAAVEPIKESPEPSAAVSATATVIPTNEKAPVALLLWKTARVYNPLFPQSTKTAKVFIDQGSQGSFITERLAAALGLKHNQNSPLIIHGVGDMEGNHFKSEQISVGIRLQDGTSHHFEAYTLPRVTTKFLHAQVTLADLPTLWENQSDELPVPLYEDEPDILIGCNFISTISPRAIKRLRSNFTLYDSELGPLIGGAGMVSAKYRQTQLIRASAVFVGNAQLSVEQLWSLDTLGIDLPNETIEDDERALHAFKKTIRRLPDGRYSVSWPWKSAHPRLVTNYGLCVGRLHSLLRSLSRQPERLRLYDETIQQQLKAGIIERAPLRPSGPLVHYVPHQAVWNEQKKKLRIVYDASASAPVGQALNDNLLRGPVFLPDLVGQLLRLRQACIALVADVEKAFLQIELNTTDRDVARFLWVDKPTEPIDPENPIITYRFARVFFGAVNSPFLLAATIKHHLQNANSPWASRIAENIYVDNVLLAANSETEAITAYWEAKKLFADACMNLREFQSNSTKVNALLAPEDRYNNTQIKVLGVVWDTMKDTIKLKTRPPSSGHLSKRSLLQFIAQQFDPLGYLSPIILPFKILLQDITKEGSAWDEEVAGPHIQKWNYLKESWDMLSFELPRRLPSGPLQLHVFADASNRAYSSVAYAKGSDKIVLLYAKSRLCPLKELTIPRLELLAVLISLRITKFLTQQLNLEDTPRTIWSDSKCALAWINSPPTEKLPRFVQNRLNEIKKTTNIRYGYVATEANPADLATRGATPRALADEQKWWQGPSWLSKSEDSWPNIPSLPTHHIARSEEPLRIAENPPTQLATATLRPPAESFTFIDMNRFSSWTRLVGSTAMTLRFIRKVHKPATTWLKQFSNRGPITAQDYLIARNCLLRQAQSNSLSTKDIIRWDLRKDETGLWRCGGRLSETTIPRPEQYPIFLPQNHRLTQLIILREHMSIFHGGALATLSRLRQHFWIPHGRRTVRAVITNHCLQCRRWKAKPFALPPMPPLPAARVQPAPAFDCTGIDLLGPIRVSTETGATKRWIALFTCLVTRAVHLEIAENLSALGLVDCLRRFIARRGLPREMISDNGTNMVLTAKSLKDIPDARSVQWTFITAFAPWKGGVYERLVGLTKTCLRRSVGRRLLSDGELRTLVAEVEAVLNERPITYVESDDIQIIRPIDYLRPRAHLSVHVERSAKEDLDFCPRPPNTRQQLLEQWSKAQECRNKFWEIWSREYLQLLRERDPRYHKGPRLQEHRIPRVGEIVLLGDATVPRAFWRLAKVVEVPIGSGNGLRTARVKCSSGRTFLRTIAQLYPVEVSSDETEQTGVDLGQTPHLRVSDKNADDSQPVLINRRITRSMTRSQQHPTTNTTYHVKFDPKASFFLLTLLTVIGLSAVAPMKVQICPYQHSGVFIRLPRSVNCTARALDRWTTHRVALYQRRLVAINATYCSQLTRTVCTWAFLRWSLQVVNDTHSMRNIPLTDCQQMQREKRLGPHILQRSDLAHKWTTAYPVQYSYGFFGERCKSTINYVLEYGEAILFDGSSPLTEFTRTAGCMPRQNHCFTPHETIIWDYAEFQHRCHYSYKGTYLAQVSADEVFIHSLQTAFIRTTAVPSLAETCEIANPVLMENDVIISFATNDNRDKTKDQSNDGNRPLLLERIENHPDQINARLQYLYDVQARRNAIQWCMSRNEYTNLVQWISISDPTAAARLLLNRTDISARYVGDTLLVSKCQKIEATKVHEDHQRDGECFEWLPVTIGQTAAFVIPHTHDVVLNSRKASCPWEGPPTHIRTMTAMSHYSFPESAPHVIFKAKHPTDISIQLLQLAVDRLGSAQFRDPGLYSTREVAKNRSSAEELIHELGHEIETTTEDIVNALDSITNQWKWLTAGGALLLLIILGIILGIKCRNIWCGRGSPNVVMVKLTDIQSAREPQSNHTVSHLPQPMNASYTPLRMPARKRTQKTHDASTIRSFTPSSAISN